MVRQGHEVTKQGRMSMTTRKELTEAIGARYLAASKSEKQKILDEFVALTGCHRKHAIRTLNGKAAADFEEKRRNRVYDEATLQALIMLWEAADRVCGKVCVRQTHPRRRDTAATACQATPTFTS